MLLSFFLTAVSPEQFLAYNRLYCQGCSWQKSLLLFVSWTENGKYQIYLNPCCISSTVLALTVFKNEYMNKWRTIGWFFQSGSVCIKGYSNILYHIKLKIIYIYLKVRLFKFFLWPSSFEIYEVNYLLSRTKAPWHK